MVGEGLLAAVPEGVHEDLVILNGDRINSRAQVKRTALHQHSNFLYAGYIQVGLECRLNRQRSSACDENDKARVLHGFIHSSM